MYDVVIIGSGIAGLTSAIYALQAEKSVLIIEKEIYGGLVINSPEIDNYPGFSNISGFELMKKIHDQALNLGAEEINGNVEKITKDKEITLHNNKVIKAKSIIIATGLTIKNLGLENEDKFFGKGISYCATCDGYFYRKKDVLVVGGGNTALEDAIYLSNICNKVYLVHRRDEFRGNSRLVTNIKKCKNISIITDSIITSINGEEKLSSATIKNNKTNEEKNIDIDGLFVAIGHIPETDFCKDTIELTKDFFVASNELCHTNVDGIFVAGDVRDKKLRQLVTAASDGAVAGNEAVEYLNNEI